MKARLSPGMARSSTDSNAIARGGNRRGSMTSVALLNKLSTASEREREEQAWGRVPVGGEGSLEPPLPPAASQASPKAETLPCRLRRFTL